MVFSVYANCAIVVSTLLAPSLAQDALSLIQKNADPVHAPRKVEFKPAKEENATAALPEVSSVLANSHKVFGQMSAQMGVLEARLAEVQKQSAVALEKQKAKHEAKLKTQKTETHAIEVANAGIVTEIAELRKSNAGLRKKANAFVRASKELRSEIQVLQANITVAQEFISKSLEVAELDGTPEVQVLKELEEQDEVQARELSHQRRLKTLGLLRMDGDEEAKPQDLLHSLVSSFDDLAKEQQVNEAALDEAFKKQWQAENDHQKALLEEQTKLNATKASETELKDRLEVAVKHVGNVHEQLLQRTQSLRLFLQHVSESTKIIKKNASH